ncbi:SIP3 [Candida jiufengensis]|uniref:SIP3 n=1 Tax=Candida jiufengensis TaxID=497108 RepID=UPI0022246830|nr:SIP3 [Candida jiufengensis]KAI5955808.1 SIP3 [Candida jiufengensis]
MSQSSGQTPQQLNSITKSGSVRSNNGSNTVNKSNQVFIKDDSIRTEGSNSNSSSTPNTQSIKRASSQRSAPAPNQNQQPVLQQHQQNQARQQQSTAQRVPLSSPPPPSQRTAQSSTHLSANNDQKHLLRQFKLISVNFKEAALDSPSFRASANHLDIQINNIEQWLLAINSSLKKIPKYVKEVEIFCNSFLEHLVPNFLQNGIVDQEYTVKCLYASLNGLKSIWGMSLNSLAPAPHILNDLNGFRKTQVQTYRELRRKFEVSQRKYDKYLSIFVSTSKTKDAIMVLEDAKQLYQVRKEYIQISLDLVVELQNISIKLDKLLVSLNSNLWQTKWGQFASDNIASDSIRESWEVVQRVQAWSDSYSSASDKLYDDMMAAKAQVEESSYIQFSPSTNSNDYHVNTISYKSLQDINETGIEKHGYLFMKTFVEKSNKPKWERRWCFIKNGVFGMLVLSPTQTSVQETDKFGIILCNLRYSPNEDRRFCFELKTSENSIILQAESLIELKSWLKVFTNERNRITMLPLNDPLFKIASSRFPPIFSEFASTINTLKDQEISNLKIINPNGESIVSTSLSRFLEGFDRTYDSKWFYKLPQVYPPIMTDTTKQAIVAYSTIRATELPTALTANIWGSVNWGLYYLKDYFSRNESLRQANHYQVKDYEMIKFQQENMTNGIPYPSFYPVELISLDIQMRALFENIVEPGEYCIMSFGCIWSPNSKQELSGRCFLTNYHIYFYMQALGFVALFKGLISECVSVEYVSQRNFGILKIYNVEGTFKLKLFLEDGILIQQKFVYLINNLASDKPNNLRESLSIFKQIEAQVAKDKEDDRILKEMDQLSKKLSTNALQNYRFTLGGGGLAMTNSTSIAPNTSGLGKFHQTDFTPEFKLLLRKTYQLPPKALFHAFLGDDSAMFRDESSIVKYSIVMKKPWRSVDGGKILTRHDIVPISVNGIKEPVLLQQTIEEMDDNEYYCFTYSVSKIEFCLGSPFTNTFKFIITGISGKRSQIYYYSKTDFSNYSIWNPLIRTIVNRIDIDQVSKYDYRINTKVMHDVGHHGPIVKAIYVYGKLSHTDDPDHIQSEPIVKIGFMVSLTMFINRMVKTIYDFINLLFDGILNVLKFILEFIQRNQFFILVIIALILSNIFFMGRSTINYWTVYRGNTLAEEFIAKNPLLLQRSVYLKDIQEEFLKPGTFENVLSNSNYVDVNNTKTTIPSLIESKPFQLFKDQSFINNYQNLSILLSDSSYIPKNYEKVQSLKNEFKEIGEKRYNYLIELQILKYKEENLLKKDFYNWLNDEISKCDYMENCIIKNVKDSKYKSKKSKKFELNEKNLINGNDNNFIDGIDNIVKYCNDCKQILREFV